VASSGFAGAIFGALFLRRFVTDTPNWLHIDLYAGTPRNVRAAESEQRPTRCAAFTAFSSNAMESRRPRQPPAGLTIGGMSLREGNARRYAAPLIFQFSSSSTHDKENQARRWSPPRRPT